MTAPAAPARYTLNDTIELDTGPHTLVSQADGVVRLRSIDTGQYMALSLPELRRRVVGDTSFLRPLAEFAKLPAHEQEAAEWWAAHVREILDGTPLREDTDPRPEYAPSQPMNAKVARKVLELSWSNTIISERSMWRKIRDFKEGGTAALVSKRGTRREGPLDRAGADYVEALHALVAAQTKASTVTETALYQKLKLELVSQGHADQIPSKSSFNRHLKVVSKGRHTTGKATSRRTAANTPDRQYRAQKRLRPGEEVQTDSTPVDILVLDHNGKPFRPTLTVFIDVRTRCVLSFTLRADGAKAVDHTTLLARAVVPRKLRPGHEEAWEHARRRLPWFQTLSEEQRSELDTTRPYIVPERIMMDNGKDFRSTVFESACRRLGITTSVAEGGTPTDKPHVERVLETLKDRFIQLLPGYTGGAIERRGEKVEEHPLLPVDVFYELLDEAIHRIYHHTPHASLGNPDTPGARLTPLEAYESSFDLCGSVIMPFDTDTYISMMATGHGMIHPVGIKFGNRIYDSPELAPYRNKQSPADPSSYRWLFQYDPYDPRAIWVENPDTGEYMECVARDYDQSGTPFAFDISEQELLRHAARHPELEEGLQRELHRLMQKAAAGAARRTMRAEIQRQMVEAEDLPHPMHSPSTRPPTPEIEDDEPDFDYQDFDSYGAS